MSANAPKASLTSAIWNWGPFYEKTIKEVQAGTWKSSAYWGGMKDKVVDIAPYGPAVTDETKNWLTLPNRILSTVNLLFLQARCMTRPVQNAYRQVRLLPIRICSPSTGLLKA